jgi:hypothetical protein
VLLINGCTAEGDSDSRSESEVADTTRLIPGHSELSASDIGDAKSALVAYFDLIRRGEYALALRQYEGRELPRDWFGGPTDTISMESMLRQACASR